MKVAPPLVGSWALQISLPVCTPKARREGSMIVPAIKTKPPAVTMGPPRLGAPRGTVIGPIVGGLASRMRRLRQGSRNRGAEKSENKCEEEPGHVRHEEEFPFRA